ncbi:hypothetical protein H4S07_004036 [Coemansia furcata]|uniref:Uncharacterized protein n=1 Tax=Coemansia furcata TaxID=417177 RepID=A0ACC1LC05_9FUNG|nr:hypothetical protein H4S07_004036 [Coemansia furcata]
MDGDAAAAIAAAAAAAAGSSPRTMPQVGPYPGRSSQHNAAAAALLAASGMHSVVLPTIASVSASLQGTPAPGERMSLSAGTDDDATAAMPSFDANALSGLPADAYSSAGQIVTSMPPLPVDHPAQSMTTPTKTPTRRRKPAAARGRPSYDSMSDDDDDDDDDDVARDERGMPLTPDAPGSGRPGSLRHLTPDERRARRLQRNRLAAKECRQKKKAYINNLEAQVCDLQEENSQLRKEIEELNVKLTLSAMRANSSVTTPIIEPRIHAPPKLPPADFSDSRNASPTVAPSKRPRLAERPSSTCDPMAWDA